MRQIIEFLAAHGGLMLFATAFVEQSGAPIPAAPWLLAAGALAAVGRMSLFGALCFGAAGALSGDIIWFYAGQHGKTRVHRLFPDLQSVSQKIAQQSRVHVVFRALQFLTAAKFLPFGNIVPLRAGALEPGLTRFLILDALCSAVYAGTYLLCGFWFHNQLERLAATVQRLGAFTVFLIVAAFASYAVYEFLKRSRAPQKAAAKEESIPQTREEKILE